MEQSWTEQARHVCAAEPLLLALAALGEDSVMFSVDYPYEDTRELRLALLTHHGHSELSGIMGTQ
jgi:predicted TIM-barrel fold metal-dependent hydrolase